jgi:hypothetical protein
MEPHMVDKQISQQEAERLKAMILSFVEGASEPPALDMIASVVSGVVNCRVEVGSAPTRKALAERYTGVTVGKSVYFSLPWQRSAKR